MADARTLEPDRRAGYRGRLVMVGHHLAGFDELIAAFRALTDEQRLEVMSECCTYCGTLRKPCYCMRDD